MKYCQGCGAELTPGELYCPECGHQVPQEQTQNTQPQNTVIGKQYFPPSMQEKQPAQNTQTQQTDAYYQSPQNTAPVYKTKTAAARKRSPLMTILIVSLAIVLAVEGVISGVWFPGFFTGGSRGGGGVLSDSEIERLANEQPEPIDEAEYKTPVKVKDIVHSYTEEEINNAPATEMKVTIDDPKAEAGSFSVDFDEWNLDNDDTFIVKELPVHKNEELGYTIKGYDFSLASGQSEFYTEVVVSVPRDPVEDERVTFITKNKETGKYERAYSEISEDGTKFLIYTTHFSEFDKLDNSDFTNGIVLDASDGSLDSQASKDAMGAFYYPFYVGPSKRMTAKVYCDERWFWDTIATRYTRAPAGFDLLPAIAEEIKKTPKDKLQYSSPLTALMWANSTVDYTNNSVTVGEAGMEKIMQQLSARNLLPGLKAGSAGTTAAASRLSVSSGLGSVCTLVGYYLTLDKMHHDAEQGKYTSWVDCYKKNWLGYLGLSIGVVGVVAVPGGALALSAAAAGMGLFAYSAYCAATEPRELSSVEQVYRDYFMTPSGESRVRIYYGDTSAANSWEQGKGYMKQLTSIDDAQNILLGYTLNYNISKMGEEPGIPGDDPMKSGKRIDRAWVIAISGLFHMLESMTENPDYVKVFKEFYHNYAEACYNMNDSTYMEFAKKAMAERGWDASLASLPDNDPQKAKEIKEDYINNLAQELMAKHADIIWKNVTFKMHCAQIEAYEIIEDVLIPNLNTMMEFRVIDNSLPDPKDFSQSAYNVHGRLYKDVDLYRTSYYGYADLSKCVDYPMYFSIKDESGKYKYVYQPIFMPRIGLGPYAPGAKYTDYYPARGNFVPKAPANKGDNLVFRCTYYHYLMMGSPTAISFRDMNDLGKNDKVAEMKFSEPDANGVIQVTIEAPPLNQPNAADLKVTEDDTMGYGIIDEIPEYAANPMPANCRISIDNDGKTVDIDMPEVSHSFHSINSTDDFSTIDYTYTYNRNAVHLKGKITEIKYDSKGNITMKKGVITSGTEPFNGMSLSESTRTRRSDGSRFDYFHKSEYKINKLTFGNADHNGKPPDKVSSFYIHYRTNTDKEEIEKVYIQLYGDIQQSVSDHRDPDHPYTTTCSGRSITLTRVD